MTSYNSLVNSIQNKIKEAFIEDGFETTILEREPKGTDYEKMVSPMDPDFEDSDKIKIPALFLYYNGHNSDVDDLSGNIKNTEVAIGFDLYGFSRANNIDIVQKLEEIILNSDIRIFNPDSSVDENYNCRQVGPFDCMPVIDEQLIKFNREDIVEFSGTFNVSLINSK